MKVLVVETQSHLAPWMQEHRGLRWEDMPGTDTDLRKLNFFLFRRGLYDPNLEPVRDEDSGLDEEELKTARRDAQGMVLVKAPQRLSFGMVRGMLRQPLREGVRRRTRAVEDVEQRRARMQGILARYAAAKVKRGFMVAMLRADETAHWAVSRALKCVRAGEGALRSGTMDRIEQAFEMLKGKGWAV